MTSAFALSSSSLSAPAFTDTDAWFRLAQQHQAAASAASVDEAEVAAEAADEPLALTASAEDNIRLYNAMLGVDWTPELAASMGIKATQPQQQQQQKQRPDQENEQSGEAAEGAGQDAAAASEQEQGEGEEKGEEGEWQSQQSQPLSQSTSHRWSDASSSSEADASTPASIAPASSTASRRRHLPLASSTRARRVARGGAASSALISASPSASSPLPAFSELELAFLRSPQVGVPSVVRPGVWVTLASKLELAADPTRRPDLEALVRAARRREEQTSEEERKERIKEEMSVRVRWILEQQQRQAQRERAERERQSEEAYAVENQRKAAGLREKERSMEPPHLDPELRPFWNIHPRLVVLQGWIGKSDDPLYPVLSDPHMQSGFKRLAEAAEAAMATGSAVDISLNDMLEEVMRLRREEKAARPPSEKVRRIRQQNERAMDEVEQLEATNKAGQTNKHTQT